MIDMSSVKMMLALTRKWQFHAIDSDILNANVKADKEEEPMPTFASLRECMLTNTREKKWV